MKENKIKIKLDTCSNFSNMKLEPSYLHKLVLDLIHVYAAAAELSEFPTFALPLGAFFGGIDKKVNYTHVPKIKFNYQIIPNFFEITEISL